MKIFDRVIFVAFYVCVAVMVFCALVLAREAAASMPHDSLDTIMAQSNPACYVRGVVERDPSIPGDNELKILRITEIEPQYYAWADVCEGLFGLHYTEFEVSEISEYPNGESLTITFILIDEERWTVYNVSRMLTGI